MFKVRDRVVVIDGGGREFHGEIANISEYREPNLRYAIDLDDYKDDYVFVPECQLREEQDDSQELDYCYECGGNGDDYYIDENGEMVCACGDCILRDLAE